MEKEENKVFKVVMMVEVTGVAESSKALVKDFFNIASNDEQLSVDPFMDPLDVSEVCKSHIVYKRLIAASDQMSTEFEKGMDSNGLSYMKNI